MVIFLDLKGFYYSYAWSCSLCEWRTFFGWNLSLENSVDSYLCFQLALLHSVSYFSFLYQSPPSSLCTVFGSISCSIKNVLWINPSLNVFVLGDFSIHHKDWLNYSGETDRLKEICCNFSISNDLIQMVNFPTWISDSDSHSPVFFWIYLFLLLLGKFWSYCCLSFH